MEVKHLVLSQKKHGMITSLRRRVDTHRVLLINAISLFGTTAVTSGLGFAYWWAAARFFSSQEVGLSSAAISAMTLLGTACVLGLGTLLVGELPRQHGKEMALISAALLVVGVLAGAAGLVFALAAPLFIPDFQPLQASINTILLFAFGVSLTSATIVLDQAVIGLLRGSLQFWRNVLFSIAKLALLFAASYLLTRTAGLAIYATWAIGSALSLLAAIIMIIWRGEWPLRAYLPQWRLLWQLVPSALQHHGLNLILQAPVLALPVLVTALLSATMNAWFYVSFMLSNFVFSVPLALTTVLYAANAAKPNDLAHKARLTLGLSMAICFVAVVVLFVMTQPVLSLFGREYAEQSVLSLHILLLGAFPVVIKNHYIAICRVRNRVVWAMIPITIFALLELGMAAVGAHLGALTGLSLGWVAALYIEMLFMLYTVYSAVRFTGASTYIDRLRQKNLFADVEPVTSSDENHLSELPILVQETLLQESMLPERWHLTHTTAKLRAISQSLSKEQAPVLASLADTTTVVVPEQEQVVEELDIEEQKTQQLVASPEMPAVEGEMVEEEEAEAITKLQWVVPETPLPESVAEEEIKEPEVTTKLQRGVPKTPQVALIADEEVEESGEDATPTAISLARSCLRETFYIVVNVICVLLSLGAFLLWFFSLGDVDVNRMNDLGLVSVLSPGILIALIVLIISYCIALRHPRLPTPVLLLQLGLLIFMLYGVTTLVEAEPRFSILYRHQGYTEYIMRTGSVDLNLDAYFNWPSFFIGVAFLNRALGFSDLLGYGAWSPVLFNLLYMAPLYVIFTSATASRRIPWLALLFFYLTNWIGQDYFSPQGFDFFLYLVIIAILLKWFKATPRRGPLITSEWARRRGRFVRLLVKGYDWLTAPDDVVNPNPGSAGQRGALLVCLLVIFGFVVSSHPLTPFFVLASVTALIFTRRCKPLWLPVVMVIMTVLWVVVMAQTFVSGHLDWITAGLGHLSSSISSNVTGRVVGNPQHIFVANVRVIMTLLIWGLAFIGGVLRLRYGHRDATMVLLAVMPFPLFVVQPYGGEMLLRVYLFALPAMAFFAAAIFFTPAFVKRAGRVTVLIMLVCLVLFGGFLFTRYGNERMDYMTSDEVAGVRHLYDIAPANSIFISGWDGAPWQFRAFEQYNLYSMAEDDGLFKALANDDVNAVTNLIDSQQYSNAYVLLTRSERVTADATSGLSPGSLDRLQNALLASGKFRLIFNSHDVQILQYIKNGKGP